MKRIIHGTLRLLLAIGGIYMFCKYFLEDYKFSTFFNSQSAGDIAGVFVIFQLTSCFVLYMGINGIRDFMSKRLRMRVMYAVNALLILALMLFAIFGKDDHSDKSEPAGNWDFLYLLAFVAIIYFIIYDFIALFIKRKKHIEKKVMAFEAEDLR